jgi:hypothetical protein
MRVHTRSARPTGHAFVPTLRNAARLAGVTAAWLALTVAPGAAAESATAPVYKCPQTGGSILYADYPCKGGAVVDIRPGVAAPDASERLARARDEIDRAAARRNAIDDAAALRREELYQRRQELDAAQAADAAAYAPDLSYLPAYGYYTPYGTAHVHRPKPRPAVDPRHVASERRVPAVIRRPQAP